MIPTRETLTRKTAFSVLSELKMKTKLKDIFAKLSRWPTKTTISVCITSKCCSLTISSAELSTDNCSLRCVEGVKKLSHCAVQRLVLILYMLDNNFQFLNLVWKFAYFLFFCFLRNKTRFLGSKDFDQVSSRNNFHPEIFLRWKSF